MPDQRIDITGWPVAEVEVYRGFGYEHQAGGRLTLYRTATDWTLVSHRTRTRYDETDHPVEGEAWVRATTYASLDDLKADLVRYEGEDWRALVKSGAGEPYYDPELMRLWAPVQIDEDLRGSSVYRRELGVHAAVRQASAWR
jgi:hypothetical protein